MDEIDETQYKSEHEEFEEIGLDERIIEVFLIIGMPFVICFITWGTIILAYSQWKLY